jgi:hypothetical protein
MTKKVKLFIFIFGLIAFSIGANFALAQADFGTSQVASTISLVQSDPRIIIGRVIQIALSFLGVVALILIMYAGFLWMSSNGDEDKITDAKKILKNAVIGLVIILSSWAIATFILSKLSAAITGEGTNNVSNSRASLADSGVGAIGACTVESFYPENNQTDVARNSSIVVTFKELIKPDSICINAAGSACACDNTSNCNKVNPENVRIYKTDLGDACASGSCPSTNANITDVTVAISSDSKTLIFTPLTYLGDGINSIWYSVKMTSDVKKSDGTSMFKACSSDFFNWKFEVNTTLDLTPPQVVAGSTFPLPDNESDVTNKTVDAQKAQGSITVNAVPRVYKASSISSVVPIGTSPDATATPLNYQGTLTKFKVVISSDISKAQLFDGNNDANLLGSADFDSQGNAKFAGYFILTAASRNAGNAWTINLVPEQTADTLTLGTEVYTFSENASGGNNIKINPVGSLPEQIANIYAILSGNPSLDVSSAGGTKINLTSKVAGTSGNNIEVSTTNTSAFKITPLSGGSDRQSLAEVKGKKDVPMNTVIQLNFSKAVNPIKVSGLASEVANYISVVNYDASSSANGISCVNNSDCRSYKCEGSSGAKTCVGDYVNGRFLVSNVYRTVEFVSDNECGVNGCGEKIYCLPADSHLAVKMKTADLKNCSTDADCAAFTPYKTCSSTPLGYKTCQNVDGNNYPTASANMNGVIDLAANSFDGDRNVVSDGPLNFYDDNFSADANKNNKDNYRFSFYVNDTIDLTPPQIESIMPAQGSSGVNLADPIKITWNTLMMNSSLTTGSRSVDNGLTTVEHKLLNLWSLTSSAVGYWVRNDNIDTATDSRPLDGEPDQTISWIEHTPFLESMSYRAQAGSGVRDIYQNCYKPSAGLNCPVSDTNPSCCFGAATSTLGADGNCQ